jgi:hypothetical protein
LLAELKSNVGSLERADAPNRRIISLHLDLRHIDTLCDELATHDAEHNPLEPGEKLAKLEAYLREDLLNGR